MKSVLIAVGHGEQPSGVHDPGAVGGGWTEQTAGDIVVDRMAGRLQAISGLTVYHEASQKDPNFYGTVANANRLGVDAVISIHHDWTGGVSGVFGFWWPGSTNGEKLTRAVVDAAKVRGFKIADKWVKARDDLYLLRKTTMPATLIECGRIGEYSPEELRGLGDAFAQGVAAYLGLSLPVPKDVILNDGSEEDVRELVANIQRSLISAGFNLGTYTPYKKGYPKGADGYWGVKTEQAFIDALKKSSGLTTAQADARYVARGTTVRIG